MCQLQQGCVVEHCSPRVYVGGGTVRGKPEAGRSVHPGIHADHAERADDACAAHRDQHQHVPSRWHPAPTVEVDADEDRLDEERYPLESERQSKNVTEPAHQPGPQQAHLKAEDGAGHSTDGEQDCRDLRPTPSEPEGDRIIPSYPAAMHDVDHRGERHAEAGQDDMPSER
jgi:hypothetical protein